MGRSTDVYFPELERGFDALYPRKVSDLVGSDYPKLRHRLCESERYRNKIFHGQLTSDYLSRQELVGYVCDIRSWCKALACGCMAEFHYDGFGRNSFQKSSIPNVSSRFKIQMAGLPDYEEFIRKHLEKHKGRGRRGSR